VAEVLMLGRLAPWKGQDVFLRAFARAFRGSPARAFVVGGPLFGETDYEQEVRDLTRELGIADRVELTGHQPDPWPYLERADVLVHASRVPEPFGQVVVQGMRTSCAVVATTPGGPAEVITDEVDGLLVPVDDEDALATALERIRTDRELRGRLRRNAAATAARFSAAVTAPPVARWLGAIASGRVSAGMTVNLDQTRAPQQVANSTGPDERSDITD
jgi:glycosyltransferase involved in cell wall biosynthesis